MCLFDVWFSVRTDNDNIHISIENDDFLLICAHVWQYSTIKVNMQFRCNTLTENVTREREIKQKRNKDNDHSSRFSSILHFKLQATHHPCGKLFDDCVALKTRAKANN